MLFNSHFFIFIFLPLTLFVFFMIGGRSHHRVAVAWLVGASLFFYGWWNPAYLGLILGSMIFNYSAGVFMNSASSSAGGSGKSRKSALIVGVAGNLALLGYFKYANFFVNTVNAAADTSYHLDTIILPLAISFFTFQQIAYLADTYRGETREHNFLHYCLFVTFFPQLIAGPIVHHKEMLPQFAGKAPYSFSYPDMVVGLSIFSIGLFKKVVIADEVALYSSPVFTAAANGAGLTFFEAWCGALAYTLQLYFDFSGYSDMAIGIGRMFGIKLPLNFHSPYKAVNIIDFWRRWHITLSRFLRDYLYIPLGGNRKGRARRYNNLFITMLLGGLWHGAGWTFVVWGALHGVYLMINHLIHAVRRALGQDIKRSTRFGRFISRGVTFIAVVVGWVFFRAESYETAKRIFSAMVGGGDGFIIPESFLKRIGPLGPYLMDSGTVFVKSHLIDGTTEIMWIILLLLFVWFAPNTQEFMARFDPAINTYGKGGEPIEPSRFAWLQWQPTFVWAIAISVITVVSILWLTRISEFLYFQF